MKLVRDTALQRVVQLQVAGPNGDTIDTGQFRFLGRASFLAPVGLASGASTARAAGGCDSAALQGLVGTLASATQFMIGIGAVGCLLMFAVGALTYMGFKPWAAIGMKGSGGQPDTYKMAAHIVKNAALGLAVLVAIAFIRWLVIEFMTGVTGNSTPNCLR